MPALRGRRQRFSRKTFQVCARSGGSFAFAPSPGCLKGGRRHFRRGFFKLAVLALLPVGMLCPGNAFAQNSPVITSPLQMTTSIGQQFTYQFTASGPGPITLMVSNLPNGLTFDQSLAAIIGQPTAGGIFSVQLQAANSNGTTQATLSLRVEPVPAPTPTPGPTPTPAATSTPCTGTVEGIVDGGFENGGIPNSFWDPETSTNFGTPLCSESLCGDGGGASPPRTGQFWAWFGGIAAPETATLGQTVTLPPVGVAILRFWMRIGQVSAPFTDVLNVRVDGAIVQSFPEPPTAETAYTQRTINLNSIANGAPHQILFEYVGPSTAIGSYVVDDVSLSAPFPCPSATTTPPPPTPTPSPTASPVPTIRITSGSSATSRVGRPFNFQVTTEGGSSSATLSASPVPAGLTADSVTGLISGIPTAIGSSSVELNVTDGVRNGHASVQFTFTGDPGLPVIVSSNGAALTPGEPFSYVIKAPNSGPSTTFRLIGQLPTGLNFDMATGTISGTFSGQPPPGADISPDLAGGIVTNVQLFATNPNGGTGTSPLIFFLAPTGLVNVSTRLVVGTGDNALIAGFIITGNAAAKKLIARGIGPSLSNFGVAGALGDPTLQLNDSSGILSLNNDWRDAQEELVNATGIPPSDNLESAVLAYLTPGSADSPANYTAIVRGNNDTTGIGLVEAYDLGTASLDPFGTTRLANISTRGVVGSGDNVMIGGFIIRRVDTRVVVRAIGPSLAAFGVSGTLQDPTLELRNADGMLVIGNDDWEDNPTQAAEIQERMLAPTDPREAALVVTLPSGQFTAIVAGKGEATGVALVEVYALE